MEYVKISYKILMRRRFPLSFYVVIEACCYIPV